MKIYKLEEKIGIMLQHLTISKDTLNRTQVCQEIRLTIDNWDLIKLKIPYHKGMKSQTTEGKEIFTSCTSHRDLISRIYKELQTKT